MFSFGEQCRNNGGRFEPVFHQRTSHYEFVRNRTLDPIVLMYHMDTGVRRFIEQSDFWYRSPIIASDRPNPISAEPNRTIFLPNYSSADRTMFGQNGRTCSVNGPNFCRRFGSAEPSVRFGFCRTCSGVGRSLLFIKPNLLDILLFIKNSFRIHPNC